MSDCKTEKDLSFFKLKSFNNSTFKGNSFFLLLYCSSTAQSNVKKIYSIVILAFLFVFQTYNPRARPITP